MPRGGSGAGRSGRNFDTARMGCRWVRRSTGRRRSRRPPVGVVPGARIELARYFIPRDFKSLASTNSAIQARTFNRAMPSGCAGNRPSREWFYYPDAAGPVKHSRFPAPPAEPKPGDSAGEASVPARPCASSAIREPDRCIFHRLVFAYFFQLFEFFAET